MLKKKLSSFYYKHIVNSAVGHRFRQKFKGEQLSELKPYDSSSVVSDLFVWRSDESWDTRFQLFNISSFLFSEERFYEECELVFFDNNGIKIKREMLSLAPFELKTFQISSFLGEAGLGTFAIFHHTAASAKLKDKKCHLTERGYVGYHRRGENLVSFCHGNLQALSKTRNSSISSVVGTVKSTTYKPQLILSDCTDIELIYTNPTFRKQPIYLNFFDRESRLIKKHEMKINPLGVQSFILQNTERLIHTFENIGKIVLWRPIIFKYYNSHFDVMHG